MTPTEKEVYETLVALLDAVCKCDVRAYRAMVADDVSSFETDIAPYRIDDLEFHVNLMTQRASAGRTNVRVDILTPRIQLYGDFAVACYTALVTNNCDGRVGFRAMNESRVFIKRDGRWMMVHLHRSPAGCDPSM